MSSEPSKKFIVAISDANAQKRDAISTRLKDRGFGYWHWMPDIWLLTTSSSVTAVSIRDSVMKAAPGVNVFVTPIATPPDGIDWALYAPEEWSEWLKKNWS